MLLVVSNIRAVPPTLWTDKTEDGTVKRVRFEIRFYDQSEVSGTAYPSEGTLKMSWLGMGAKWFVQEFIKIVEPDEIQL